MQWSWKPGEIAGIGIWQDFPVVDGEQVVGVLTCTDLLAGRPQGQRIGDIMRRDCGAVEDGAMLEQIT